MSKSVTFKPSTRTYQRIRNNPKSAISTSLYAYARQNRVTMEEVLGVPLYLLGKRIDGFVQYNGFIYAFDRETPKKPLKSCLYVFKTDKGVALSRKSRLLNADRIGVCVAKIKLLQTENTEENALIEFTREDAG